MKFNFKPAPIEPKILPLVEAINQLNIVETFSSCEGHFKDDHGELMDKNKADVRFDALPDVSLDDVERFITYLITEFNNEQSFSPVQLVGHKLYCPNDEYVPDFTFVIQLKPFDRFDPPSKKRVEIDLAILQAAEIVKKYKIS